VRVTLNSGSEASLEVHLRHGFVRIAALGFLLAAAAALLLRLRLPSPAHAQSGCSAGTLQGTYGIHIQGWAAQSGSTTVPFAQIGLMNADGAGAVRLAVTSNMGGQISRDIFTYTSEVNPDCTGSLTPTPGIPAGPADFVIVNGGKQVFLVVTLAQTGFVLSGEAVQR
jgi:hypothetical protein